MARFKLDKRAILRSIQPKMHEVAREITVDYDRMRQRLKNRSLEEVKAELVRYHQGRGGEITDPDLTSHAEQLQAGERVVFEYRGHTVGWT